METNVAHGKYLTEKQRQIVHLREVDGLTNRQAADKLNVHIHTVYTTYLAAKRVQELAERPDENPFLGLSNKCVNAFEYAKITTVEQLRQAVVTGKPDLMAYRLFGRGAMNEVLAFLGLPSLPERHRVFRVCPHCGKAI